MPLTAIWREQHREYFYLQPLGLNFFVLQQKNFLFMARKVVIIDDEKDLCLLIKSFLLQHELIVFTSHSLRDGLQMIQDIQPDILIMDNNLPDGSGWDHLNLIRGQLPHCKIILISAFNARFPPGLQHVSVLEKPVSLLKLQSYLA